VTKVFKAVISKDQLTSVTEQERVFFLSIGHFANEVNVLQKMLLWSSDFDAQPDAVLKANITSALVFLRLLAGKLKEGHNLLSKYYFGARLSHSYDALLSKVAYDALAFLKQYFSKKNDVDHIRNNYAFHYSPLKANAELMDVPDDLELFVAEDYGNTLYYAQEVLANRALFRSLGDEDLQKSFSKLIEEVLEVAKYFSVFTTGFMEALLNQHAELLDGVAQPVELGTLPCLLDVQIPWFTDNSRHSSYTEGSD